MSDFDSGNSVNCVLLDVNLYETKRQKYLVPYTSTCTTKQEKADHSLRFKTLDFHVSPKKSGSLRTT